VRKNRYEEACHVIMHILMAASAGDENALKRFFLNASSESVTHVTFLLFFSAFTQGINMNIGDYDGRTALHLVAAEGHLRCVRFLLDVCKVKHNPMDRWVELHIKMTFAFTHYPSQVGSDPSSGSHQLQACQSCSSPKTTREIFKGNTSK